MNYYRKDDLIYTDPILLTLAKDSKIQIIFSLKN